MKRSESSWIYGILSLFLQNENELSTLEYMDFWMRSIHAHAAENTSDDVDNTTLSPPIFVVGTHRNSLHENPEVQAEMVRFCITSYRMTSRSWLFIRFLLLPSLSPIMFCVCKL